jgi:SAM-dependent MidA family methyltransferase
MSRRMGVVVSIGLLFTLSQACGDPVGPSKPDPITELPRALTSAETQVIAKATSFGFDLLREVDARRKTDQPNTIISPLSASMALGMALEGADGETYSEMRSTLGFEGMARDDINDSYSGLMDLLLALEKAECLPHKYYILEVSADLRQRQQALFEKQIPHLAPQIEWIEQLPTQFNGLILANEVLDAMPVHLVTWSNDQCYERGVTWKNNQFEWLEQPLTNTELINIANQLAPQINQGDDIISAYTSEISLTTRRFIHSMADILQQGLMLFIDYGFGQSEYYHPQRSQGTLMCHYRHYAHGNPFYFPGIQDITSHVDFSAIYEAAEKSRLALMGYNNQAHFLINCGITELLTESDTSNHLALNNQLQTLVSPAEMGELFKVIAFGKNIAQPLVGFSSGDKSRLL